MTYPAAEAYIHSFTRFGSQLGLERMEKLLSLMGNPQNELKYIHIAGTNGKGSVTRMCSGILQEAGYKVGMYISPFVIDFRERFQINGEMIPRMTFARLASEIQPLVIQLASQGDNVTEFEVITAIAFKYFADEKCDVVCLEVGLGGKYDATNIISTPEAAIITSISLDHTEILGDTIEKIAGEKAGIIKKNTEVITYPAQSTSALGVLIERCHGTDSRLSIPNKSSIKIYSCDTQGSSFQYNGHDFRLRLVGEHQIYNAAAVIEAMYLLRSKGWNISDSDIFFGIAKAEFPARFEFMRRSPIVIVDGAHNLEGAQALAKSIKLLQASPKVAVMGMLADKDYHSSLGCILSECEALIAIPVNNPRAVEPAVLAESAKDFCKNITVEPDYEKAIEKAASICGKDGAIIVCGSFYMASDMRKTIHQYNRTHKQN